MIRKSFYQRNRTYIIVGTIVVAISALLILELTNTTHLFHKEKAVSGLIPVNNSPPSKNQPSSTSDNPGGGASQTNNPTSTPEKSTSTPSIGSDLVAPYGSFVSNHSPSLKNQSNEESICLTTPGATCKIEFIKDGVTKTLEAKKADSNGTATWIWDIDSAGFEEGSWKITAIAVLNGKTKASSDIQNLEVHP